MNQITIGDHDIGNDCPTFVIAEAGSNHNGDLDTARELIEAAADAGADGVKFQTFRAEDLYVEDSGSVEYLEDNRSIFEIVEEMEMPYEWIPRLHEWCQECGVEFMSTPFDENSAAELEPYVPAFKVASYTMSHHPFLRHLAKMEKPIIMSTGAQEFEEVRESVEVLRAEGVSELALLQCVAAYPTPIKSINVRVVDLYKEEFDVVAGLSDHTMDPITAPTTAVALGAGVVEKHFTLDKEMEGPDHRFALNPEDLGSMINAIRETEEALGSGEKTVLDVENELYDVARRSIQAMMDIEAGSVLSKRNIAVLRSGNRSQGLHPKFYEELLGRKTNSFIPAGNGITWEHVGE